MVATTCYSAGSVVDGKTKCKSIAAIDQQWLHPFLEPTYTYRYQALSLVSFITSSLEFDLDFVQLPRVAIPRRFWNMRVLLSDISICWQLQTNPALMDEYWLCNQSTSTSTNFRWKFGRHLKWQMIFLCSDHQIYRRLAANTWKARRCTMYAVRQAQPDLYSAF